MGVRNPQIAQMAQIETRDSRTHAIIGAAMRVHNELGCGFLEAVYQEALAMEFDQQGIPFVAQVELPIVFRGRQLSAGYRVDFICFDGVVVEIKALAALTGAEDAQIINYLKATGAEVGLLLNFGTDSLQYRRRILSKKASAESAKSADLRSGR